MISTTNETLIGIDLPVLLWSHIEWQKDALCADSGLDFFEIKNKGQARLAQAVCAECPVREDCLTFAQKNNIRDGIWGGKTPKERLT